MPLINYPRNSDGTYGPTTREHLYESKHDHRRTARKRKDKTRWKVKEGEEYCIFKIANEFLPNWFFCQENNCLFGLIDECDQVIGENGERLAKFPNDRNPNDSWHGYPVFSQESQNRPSSELLDYLEEMKVIPFHVRMKIEKGAL